MTWQCAKRSTVTGTCSPASVNTRVIPTFCATTPERIANPSRPYSLISTSTPAARSSFISASTVCGVGSMMSKSRLWVRISNCSRLFLSTCGERLTVKRSILVGSGIGPRTWAPVRLAVFTISLVELSRIRWSKALSRIRMFWPCMFCLLRLSRSRLPQLFNDLDDDAGADGSATLADRESELLFHRNRHDQLDLDRHVVSRHHHLGALRQLHDPRHVRGPEVELGTIVAEERRVAPTLLLGQDVGF